MPNDDFDNNFNRLVKERTKQEYRRLRDEYGISQTDAAEKLGYSDRQYQNLEGGKGTTNLTKHLSNFRKLIMAYLSDSAKISGRREQRITTTQNSEMEASRLSKEILQRVLDERGE